MKRCIICGNLGDDNSTVCEVCGNPYLDLDEGDRGDGAARSELEVAVTLEEEPQEAAQRVEKGLADLAAKQENKENKPEIAFERELIERKILQSAAAEQSGDAVKGQTAAGAEEQNSKKTAGPEVMRQEKAPTENSSVSSDAQAVSGETEAAKNVALPEVEIAGHTVQQDPGHPAHRLKSGPHIYGQEEDQRMMADDGQSGIIRREFHGRSQAAGMDRIAGAPGQKDESGNSGQAAGVNRAAGMQGQMAGMGRPMGGQSQMVRANRPVNGQNPTSAANRSANAPRMAGAANGTGHPAAAGNRAANGPARSMPGAGRSMQGNGPARPVNGAGRPAGAGTRPMTGTARPVNSAGRPMQGNAGAGRPGAVQGGPAARQMGVIGQKIRSTSRSVMKSPLFLLVALLQTAFLVGSVASIFMQELNFSQYARLITDVRLPKQLVGYMDDFIRLMGKLDTDAIVLNLVFQVPDLLMCLGLWLVVFSCRTKKSRMNGAGFTLMKAVVIIAMIKNCLIMLAGLVISVALVVSAWASETQSLIIAAVVTLIIMIVLTMMVIMYHFSYLGMIKTFRRNAIDGESYGRASGYVAVVYIIMGLTAIVGILSGVVNSEISCIVSSAGKLGWMVLFAVWIFKYRKKMSEVED